VSDRTSSVDDRALGTSLRVVVTREADLRAVKEAVDTVVRDIDKTCSRFRDDSEISRLASAAGRDAPVSPLLMTALRAALRGAELSGGAVDPTVGTAVKAVGYLHDFSGVPADGPAISVETRPVAGWRCLRLNEVSRTVFVPVGVELDLGSTAKALAADLAAAAALRATPTGGVLVSLGGDIVVAGTPPDGGWAIHAAEDSGAAADAPGETVVIRSGGLCTSSTTVRSWKRGGIVLHHIIDPATGLPAQGPWRTVTVIAANCLDANIAATASIVRGQEALSWLSSLRLPARLVDREGAVSHTPDWPTPGSASDTRSG